MARYFNEYKNSLDKINPTFHQQYRDFVKLFELKQEMIRLQNELDYATNYLKQYKEDFSILSNKFITNKLDLGTKTVTDSKTKEPKTVKNEITLLSQKKRSKLNSVTTIEELHQLFDEYTEPLKIKEPETTVDPAQTFTLEDLKSMTFDEFKQLTQNVDEVSSPSNSNNK